MTDIVELARRHRHIAATHYEGCEADHIGCLVVKLADEVERLREALRWIATVNALDYEYQVRACQALEGAP